MSYFVTGATGFIGRHLVERLLEREGDIHVLVREGSRGQARRAASSAGAQADRVKPVDRRPHRAAARASDEDTRRRSQGVDHFFHLAAIYDMTADEERNALLNVGGTQNAVDLANELGAGHFHHVSSIAVAGALRRPLHRGHVRRGPEAPAPVPPDQVRGREARARAGHRCRGASTARRSSSATRRTGEMDKIDGPYYFFKAIQKVRHALPEWFPLVGLEVGWTNIVPVDYVAAAMDHIAHQDGPRRPGVPPRQPEAAARRRGASTRSPRAGHAPQMVMRVDKRMTDMLPEGRAVATR